MVWDMGCKPIVVLDTMSAVVEGGFLKLHM